MTHDTPYINEDLKRIRDEFDSGQVHVDESEPVTVVETDHSGRSAVLSVRLPVSVITLLKRAAEEREIGATVLARHLITAGLAELNQNPIHEVHVSMTLSGGHVVDVRVDDPVAAIGNDPQEIELEPIRPSIGEISVHKT